MDRHPRVGSLRSAAAVLATLVLVALLPAPSVLAAASTRAGTASSSTPGAPGGPPVKVIVRFEDRPGAAGEKAIREAGGTVRFRYRIVPALAATVPLAAIDGLRRNPNVAAVELDGAIAAFDHGGATGDLEYENAWGVEHIGAKPVHDAGFRGDGIRVAIIDTGIDYIHDKPPAQEPPVVDPEFNGTYRGGYDFVNGDADPFDDNGHGTHVAGILAADHNGYLVVGVAPEVELYALKVLGATGEGDYSGLIAALDWAVVNGMDVVNMSLGGHDVSDTLAAAVAAAAEAGLVLVAASGNVNPAVWQEILYGCQVAYPAAYPEVFATTFTNASDALTGYSCTGNAVDFASPGDQIFSPVPAGPAGSCMFCSPNGYSAQSGTSMASPHLAGLVALVLDHGIADTNGDGFLADDVKAHLCANTVPGTRAFNGWSYAQLYGCGVINARKALVENPPPVAAGAPTAVDDGAATAEDTPLDIDVLANDSDPDSDPLSVSAVSGASHGSATIGSGGQVHYVPVADFNGSDTFGYTVSDGQGSAVATVSITVTPVNDVPVTVDDDLVTVRDVPSTIDVLVNDTDVDGDALTVTTVTAAGHGVVVIEPGGSLTYTPASDYAGADAFDYSVSDGAGGSAVGHVSVTVLAANHPPVAADDAATTAEDTDVAIDVLANDTDADGGALVVATVTQPTNGSVTIDGNGRVRYVPASDFNGVDAFGYTVEDGAGATDSATATVTVTAANDPPVAVDDSATTPEDTAITVDLAANDSDIDGDALAVLSVDTPSLGSAVVSGGQVVYTPLADIYGSDSFTYTVSDGEGGTDVATATVTILPVNDVPTAAAKTVSTAYQTAVSITLTGSDVETCDLGFEIVTPPTHGTLSAPSSVLCVTLLPPYSDSSRVTYTPSPGYSGADTFTYRTSDGLLASPPATVSITVAPALPFHIGDLDATRTIQKTSWTARVTLRVDTEAHTPRSNATVTGTWSIGGVSSCKTGTSGTCSVSKTKIPSTTTPISFTVTGIAYPAGTYVPGSNHDPDGDSNGTTISIAR